MVAYIAWRTFGSYSLWVFQEKEWALDLAENGDLSDNPYTWRTAFWMSPLWRGGLHGLLGLGRA
jgi:hypothetical protein